MYIIREKTRHLSRRGFGRGGFETPKKEREKERTTKRHTHNKKSSEHQSMMDKIVAFFKPPDPKTLAKQWQSQIRKEQRQLDAQVRDIERELAKTRREIKACLKRKDQKSAKVLAMHTCKARKTIEALYETKANYDSISMRLGESVGRLTQVGSVGKSSEILKVRL